MFYKKVKCFLIQFKPNAILLNQIHNVSFG